MFIFQPVARHRPRAMSAHGARSALKITNGGFFERGITGITNYELRRHLLKSLIIRLVRLSRSRLAAALAAIVWRRRRAATSKRRSLRSADDKRELTGVSA
jgi:hypothetical protein